MLRANKHAWGETVALLVLAVVGGCSSTNGAVTADAANVDSALACQLSSDCTRGRYCLPSRVCGFDCREDRDCIALGTGSICDPAAGRCVSAVDGGPDDGPQDRPAPDVPPTGDGAFDAAVADGARDAATVELGLVDVSAPDVGAGDTGASDVVAADATVDRSPVDAIGDASLADVTDAPDVPPGADVLGDDVAPPDAGAAGCGTERMMCGTACVDLRTDPSSCGACGFACPTSAHGATACTAGACGLLCNAGYHRCGPACVDSGAVATCGSRCTTCPDVPHGTASCDGTLCRYDVTLQPGPADGKDIWTTSVFSYAPGGGGPGGGLNDEGLRVGGWGDDYVALIEFDLRGLPPSPTSASLELYCHSSGDGSTTPMWLDRIVDEWDWRTRGTGRDRVRLWWADRPATVLWNTSMLPAPTVGASYRVDVTGLVTAWVNGTHPNRGLELRPTSTSHTLNLFYSADYTVDPSRRPRLTIRY